MSSCYCVSIYICIYYLFFARDRDVCIRKPTDRDDGRRLTGAYSHFSRAHHKTHTHKKKTKQKKQKTYESRGNKQVYLKKESIVEREL